MRDGGAGLDGFLVRLSVSVDVLDRFDVETFCWCMAYCCGVEEELFGKQVLLDSCLGFAFVFKDLRSPILLRLQGLDNDG